MSKIIVHTEVMGPDFSELVLHELNYEWSREVVTLAASEADLPFGMVLMRESGEYKPLTESTVESAHRHPAWGHPERRGPQVRRQRHHIAGRGQAGPVRSRHRHQGVTHAHAALSHGVRVHRNDRGGQQTARASLLFQAVVRGEGREDHDRFPRHQARPHRADRRLGAQYRPGEPCRARGQAGVEAPFLRASGAVRHVGARRPSGRAGVRLHRADLCCRSLQRQDAAVEGQLGGDDGVPSARSHQRRGARC